MPTDIEILNLSPDAREVEYIGELRTGFNDAVELDPKAGDTFEILDFTVFLATGTITASLQINNGTGFSAVTGCDAIAVTNTISSYTAGSGRVCNQNKRMRILFSSNVDATRVRWKVRCRLVV